MKDETLVVHAGYQTDPTTKSVAVPIYQTVAYEFDDAQHGADLFNLAVPGNIYTRIMNPTADVLEKRVAALEGGIAGLALSAGSAAINYAILTLAKAGSNIVSVPHALRRHLHALRPHAARPRHRGALRHRRQRRGAGDAHRRQDRGGLHRDHRQPGRQHPGHRGHRRHGAPPWRARHRRFRPWPRRSCSSPSSTAWISSCTP